MIKFDSEKWKAYDPDSILLLEKENFDLNLKDFSNYIVPREDLLQFTSRATKIIIDYGYYGDTEKMDGTWLVLVVDSKSINAWDTPVEKFRYPYDRFIEGIECVEKMIIKYTYPLL